MYCGDCHAKVESDQVFCDKCGADRPRGGWGPDTLPGTIVAGKYRLEERLGSGGMGYVYRAHHVELGTDFAIKFVHRDLTTSVHKKRFTREARFSAALRSPHTVQVVDFGGTGDRLYLVMEYVAGPNLRDHVDKQGAPSVAFVVELMRQVATALEEAHERGAVHRDIKPENILIAPARRGFRFKLADFGIATLMTETNERLTRTGMVNGSPGYMSPEQASGERHLDGRADLYALGVLAWELLAHRPMFEASTPMELIVLHMKEEPESLRALRPPPSVPASLHTVIETLLCKDRVDRYRDAGELLTALQGVDLSEVPSAEPAVARGPLPAADDVDDAPTVPNTPLTADQVAEARRRAAQERGSPQQMPKTRALRQSSPTVTKQPTPVTRPSAARGRASAPDLPTGKHSTSGATERIETLAGTPYGYDPVGNPLLAAKQDAAEPSPESTVRSGPEGMRAPRYVPPAPAPPPTPDAAEAAKKPGSRPERALGESLGDFDDVYEAKLPRSRAQLVLVAAGALAAAAWAWFRFGG